MWVTPFQLLPLTDGAENPAVSDHGHGDATIPKNELSRNSTAASAAKVFLRTVEKTSEAFPPLKSVAAGLCAVLDNCDVWSTFVSSIRDAHTCPSKQWSANRRYSL